MTDDTDSLREVRVRKFLDERLAGVVALLVLLAVLGGWVAYGTHVDPGTVVEEETVATWEEQSAVSHQATVERENPVFARGQTLDDRSHYFTRVSPTLEGEYSYRYAASDGGELDVELATALQVRAVDEDGNAYWQRTEPLNRSEASSLAPGEAATVPFAFNVSRAALELERIESSLDTTVGDAEVTVLVDAHVTGVVNGEQVTHHHRDEVVVRPDGGVYRVEPGEPLEQTHERTRPVESSATYGPLRSYGSVLLVVLALGGLAGCLWLRHREALAPTEAQLSTLERRRERAEFEDWISRGQVPADVLEGPGIELDSLGDLVDVAIDTNNRVIEDSETGAFVVVGDENWYYTAGPELPDTPLQRLGGGDELISAAWRDATAGSQEAGPAADGERKASTDGHQAGQNS